MTNDASRASAVSACRAPSDSHPFALPTERLAQVAELVLNQSIDPLTRRAHRFAHVVLDTIHRDAVEEVTAVLSRPDRARGAGAQR